MIRAWLRLSLFALAIGTAPAVQAQDPTFLFEFGEPGSDPGQLNVPGALVLDASGRIYVTEFTNRRVQIFEDEGDSASYVTHWAPSPFTAPTGIALDLPGNVYVVLKGLHKVRKHASDGTLITEWGTNGSGNGQFDRPHGVAVDASGNVYVTDQDNSRIQKFDSSGNYLLQWGSAGSGDGQFSFVSDIEAGPNGNIYVVDTGNSRIQVFDTSGTYLFQWGTFGSGNGQFRSPGGIGIDPPGEVYVQDSDIIRIQKFDEDGNFLLEWGNVGVFDRPSDVAAGNGRIYVTDSFAHKVVVFAAMPVPVLETTWGRVKSDFR